MIIHENQTETTLQEYEIDYLPKVDEVFYMYDYGCYEGSGHMIEGKYAHHDMGHCSCYGPTETVNTYWYPTLKALLGSMSEELKSQVAKVIEAYNIT